MARAALACGVSTGADFVALMVLLRVFGTPTWLAAVVGSSLGAVLNYILQRRVVFKSRGEKKRVQLPRYLAVAGSTVLLSTIVTTALIDGLGITDVIARAIAAAALFLGWHYPLAKLVFRRGQRAPSERVARDVSVSRNHGGAIMQPYLSVIIPAYNESERIPRAIEDIRAVIERWPFPVEVIVVDDGSSDETAAVVAACAERIPQLRLVSYMPNQGKGFAVRTGVLEARGEIVLFMDADNSVPLEQASALIRAIEEGADAAIGSRYIQPSRTEKAPPWYRVAWSRLTNAIVQRSLLPGIKDTQCGFKAFRTATARPAFEQLTIRGWGFDLELLTILHRSNRSIVEISVPFRDDRRTKINPLPDAWRVVRDYLTVQRNVLGGRYELARTTPVSPA